jgi:putative phosphoribosyl transferase
MDRGPAPQRFADRAHAGRLLADALAAYRGRDDVVVLGLPRGGVPVAYEVARALGAPLEVFLVRKLGLPGHEELAMGAIASGGVRVVNEDVVMQLQVPEAVLDRVAAHEAHELIRREIAYRGDLPPPELHGRIGILVDDGLATGSTMRAAVRALRLLGPARVVVAVPVAADPTCEALREEADEVVCVLTPPNFRAVGLWYEDFAQTEDDEVRALLRAAREPRVTPAP